MTTRYLGTVFVISLLLTTGCVRRTVVQDFGLTGRVSRTASPDTSIRTIFQKQKRAYNPLSDDSRIQALQNRVKAEPADLDARFDLAGAYEAGQLFGEALEQYTESFGVVRSEKAILGI